MHRSAQGRAPGEKPGTIISNAPATIAAISTPAGEGAIALIRLSGADAIAVADRIFRGKQKPSEVASHTQRLGEIVTSDGRVIDQVMLAVHRAPGSYTGEDLVEISGHGGMLVSAKVLEACLAAGARAAEPGEFTERAFRNGKMDLTQAEAVADLIRAQTDRALRSATEQLEGRLGAKIRILREELISLRAQLEASLDFSEEGIAPEEGEELTSRFASIRRQLEELLATADEGRILREGVRVVIYGATNAGKSSLLNRLLGFDRAIVSNIPGTTRDMIEEVINLRGVPVRLMDTAGLRDSIDELERAGMERTEKSRELADLILHVADGNAPRSPDFEAREIDERELLLLNKSDLPEHKDWVAKHALRISCVAEDGLRGLPEAILERAIRHRANTESELAINARHRDCLRRALAAVERAEAAHSDGLSAELVTVDLRDALDAVGEVVGAVDVEEVLGSLFRQFCIGK